MALLSFFPIISPVIGQRVHPNTPPQLHSYMVAKIKRKRTNSGKSIGGSNSKNVALKTVTTALQQQWEEEDRKDQQTQSPRRVKSQNAKRYDSFAGQWLSFAGGGGMEDGRDGGVLEAFTGEFVKSLRVKSELWLRHKRFDLFAG